MRKVRPLNPRLDLTTGQVARLLGFGIRTAERMYDQGLLRGYLLPPIPGSKQGRHRRFKREDVMEFAEKNGLPHLDQLRRELWP